MFRRRDEEENALDAANTELKSPATFGNFMDNETPETAKKESNTTARSIFGIPTAKQATVAPQAPQAETASPFQTPFQAKTEAKVEPKPEVKPEAAIAEKAPFSASPSSPAQQPSALNTGVTGLFSRPAAATDAPSKGSTYKLSAGGALTPANIGTSANTTNVSAIKAPQTTTGAGMSNIDKIETEKRLTVGYGITLEGKISNCDKLIVYGHVHADLNDVKTLHISESGKFSGFASIENAEISGAFEGDLIVENSIVINSTGKMSGKVTYGSIEIKPGGKFTGQIVDAADAEPDARAKKTAKKKAEGAEEFKLSPEPLEAKEKEELFA